MDISKYGKWCTQGILKVLYKYDISTKSYIATAFLTESFFLIRAFTLTSLEQEVQEKPYISCIPLYKQAKKNSFGKYVFQRNERW